MIVACTGVCHLVDESYLNDTWNQILIDVWYGMVDGKPAGDIHFQRVEGKVQAISPVPWGIGPLTIASLFQNVFILQEQKEKIETVVQHLFWN
jgi:methylenetetrahydrofolate dehydrogenase (NADP+)/methenyltetrahydrofolate cyclohydrolase